MNTEKNSQLTIVSIKVKMKLNFKYINLGNYKHQCKNLKYQDYLFLGKEQSDYQALKRNFLDQLVFPLQDPVDSARLEKQWDVVL